MMDWSKRKLTRAERHFRDLLKEQGIEYRKIRPFTNPKTEEVFTASFYIRNLRLIFSVGGNDRPDFLDKKGIKVEPVPLTNREEWPGIISKAIRERREHAFAALAKQRPVAKPKDRSKEKAQAISNHLELFGPITRKAPLKAVVRTTRDHKNSNTTSPRSEQAKPLPKYIVRKKAK